MTRTYKHLLIRFFCLFLAVFPIFADRAAFCCRASDFSCVVLSHYARNLDIGSSFYLNAFSTDGKKVTFSSSGPKTASVSRYGLVTAKKAGSVRITAKAGNSEAVCHVTVRKTVLLLNKSSVKLEVGETFSLKTVVSSGHTPAYASSKSSVASVDENGCITARKPGSASITVSADGSRRTCRVTVRKPTVTLSRRSYSCYRNGVFRLAVTTSSKSTPVFHSDKRSVATVNEQGIVTAHKHGSARITVTVDGVSRICRLTVKQPKIRFTPDLVTLRAGEAFTPKVFVSSGITPAFSSSNINIASVDKDGTIHARQPGRAYIYAKEDGSRASLILHVE